MNKKHLSIDERIMCQEFDNSLKRAQEYYKKWLESISTKDGSALQPNGYNGDFAKIHVKSSVDSISAGERLRQIIAMMIEDGSIVKGGVWETELDAIAWFIDG